MTKGASASLASRRAISVLPHPVGPIMRMFFGTISSCRHPNPASCQAIGPCSRNMVVRMKLCTVDHHPGNVGQHLHRARNLSSPPPVSKGICNSSFGIRLHMPEHQPCPLLSLDRPRFTLKLMKTALPGQQCTGPIDQQLAWVSSLCPDHPPAGK